MKKRIKRSPDDADAGACALAVVRWILQSVPGSTLLKPGGAETAQAKALPKNLLQYFDIDAPENTYKNPGF